MRKFLYFFVNDRLTQLLLVAFISLSGISTSIASSYNEPTNYSHKQFKEAPQISVDKKSGELNLKLDVAYAQHQFTTFQNGISVTKTLNLRSYNQEIVGPTIIARPGDTLKIHLTNSLPPEQNPMQCDANGHCNHNEPHNFNTTNLHFHGLHVDPGGISDNVMIRVAPNGEQHYEVYIPNNHVAGTFWYHTHVHGAASVQVGSGMAGALIIRGDYDEVKEIDKAN